MLNWGIAFYGAGNWTWRKIDKKYLWNKVFKCTFGELWNKK